MEFYDRTSGVLFESYVKCISATNSEEIQKKVSRSLLATETLFRMLSIQSEQVAC
jgi:hypothetical protein